MKSSLRKEDILNIYGQIRKDIGKCIKSNDFERAITLIEFVGNFAYYFNQFFFDNEIENSICELSDRILPTTNIEQSENKRCIFIDSFGIDNRGLTQQYLRALMSNKYTFLYIDENNPECGSNIISEIKNYKDGDICLLNDKTLSKVERIKKLHQIIVDYSPSFIVCHLSPNDVSVLAAIHKVTGIKKYNINLTDEAFWLGPTFFDYNIEFRNYGYTISLEKRGFKKHQLLELPYYPIFPEVNIQFAGFSEEINKYEFKILAGGSFYKFFNKEKTFFSIMDKLLDAIPNSVIIIAGGASKSLTNDFLHEIGKLQNSDRIKLIGNRKDINEVFKHVDVYLSSYPISGALMAQFAAINAIPILSYSERELKDNNLEDLVSYHYETKFTFDNLDDLLSYAKSLYNDRSYRIQEGKTLQKAMMKREDFETLFSDVLSDVNTKRLEKINLDYDYISAAHLNLRSNKTYILIMSLLKHYGIKSFLSFPKYTPLFAKSMVKYILNRS